MFGRNTMRGLIAPTTGLSYSFRWGGVQPTRSNPLGWSETTPRSAFGASPQGTPKGAPLADRQSRIRGGRSIRLFHAVGVPQGAVEN